MSPKEIEGILLQVLKEVQELSGRPWVGLKPQECPIGALDGFDSLCSMEATIQVEQRLGGLRLCTCSLFITEDKGSERRALSIEEISQNILKHPSRQKQEKR